MLEAKRMACRRLVQASLEHRTNLVQQKSMGRIPSYSLLLDRCDPNSTPKIESRSAPRVIWAIIKPRADSTKSCLGLMHEAIGDVTLATSVVLLYGRRRHETDLQCNPGALVNVKTIRGSTGLITRSPPSLMQDHSVPAKTPRRMIASSTKTIKNLMLSYETQPAIVSWHL